LTKVMFKKLKGDRILAGTICPHLTQDLSTKPADVLCQQIDGRNRVVSAEII